MDSICSIFSAAETVSSRNKNLKAEVMSSSFPIRMRSTVRKPNNDCEYTFAQRIIHFLVYIFSLLTYEMR